MAYIVATKPARFEARESRSTPNGPRSRTLASFRELDDQVVEKIRERAASPPEAAELRRLASRAGAPIALSPADRAARDLIAELGKGNAPSPRFGQLLNGLLESDGVDPPPPLEDAARSVTAWIASTPAERGRALVDLLLLGDAVPRGPAIRDELFFPRLSSTADA